jgi:peptide/nickel transport system permease protein
MVGLASLGALMALGVLAPVLVPYDAYAMAFEARLQPPSPQFPAGTDEFGRDVFRMLIWGSRASLIAGSIAVTISAFLGITIGIVAGYSPRADAVLMRLVDIWLAFPALLLAIAIVAVVGTGLRNAMIAVGIAAAPAFIRVVRGAVLSIKGQEYVEAARALGAADDRILIRHVLPNIVSPIIVMATLQFGGAILATAALSFLGLGAQPPTPEWGAMAFAGRAFLREAWWMSLFPGVAILIAVLSLNLLGDGLRDALDPRLK